MQNEKYVYTLLMKIWLNEYLYMQNFVLKVVIHEILIQRGAEKRKGAIQIEGSTLDL